MIQILDALITNAINGLVLSGTLLVAIVHLEMQLARDEAY